MTVTVPDSGPFFDTMPPPTQEVVGRVGSFTTEGETSGSPWTTGPRTSLRKTDVRLYVPSSDRKVFPVGPTGTTPAAVGLSVSLSSAPWFDTGESTSHWNRAETEGPR